MNSKYDYKKAWINLENQEEEDLQAYNARYMTFLSQGKTEREGIVKAIELARAKGFLSFEEVKSKGKPKAGDRIYFVNREKAIALFVIGEKPIEQGIRLVAAHIDAPHIDIKQHPIYEEEGLVLLKSHYYGGIKKYQWPTIPLALHGIVLKENGERINIVVGEEDTDPILYITDLLPHMAKEQMVKTLGDGIVGEHLTPIIGHQPMTREDGTCSAKSGILKILKETYNIEEDDFISAELSLVPAGKAREVGLDRSLVAAHGHDDKICSYAALEAILKVERPKKTASSFLVDKEENGSRGNTSMDTRFFENCLAELIALSGEYNEITLRRGLARAEILSADVCASIDPNFQEINDPRNAPRMGYGVTVVKYSGGNGKMGSNDSNAEFVVKLRKLLNENHVAWQTGEIGKIDQGGAGTIAYILARYGGEVIDCGTGVLSMHAPVELASKFDTYMTYKAYHVFLKE